MGSPRLSQPADETIQRRLEMLQALYPDYSEAELRQAYENLIHYFDMIWRFYERMLKDGTLEALFDSGPKDLYDTGAAGDTEKLT